MQRYNRKKQPKEEQHHQFIDSYYYYYGDDDFDDFDNDDYDYFEYCNSYQYCDVDVETEFNILSFYNDRYYLDTESTKPYINVTFWRYNAWGYKYFSKILNPDNFNLKKHSFVKQIDNNSIYSLEKRRDLLIDSILSVEVEKEPQISNYCKNWKVLD